MSSPKDYIKSKNELLSSSFGSILNIITQQPRSHTINLTHTRRSIHLDPRRRTNTTHPRTHRITHQTQTANHSTVSSHLHKPLYDHVCNHPRSSSGGGSRHIADGGHASCRPLLYANAAPTVVVFGGVSSQGQGASANGQLGPNSQNSLPSTCSVRS